MVDRKFKTRLATIPYLWRAVKKYKTRYSEIH
jgi:hypothetical protein